MKVLSINEIQDITMKMFGRIPNHKDINFFISFKETNYDCMPFVSVDASGYHLKCYERGRLIQDYVTLDLNELLYNIFQEVTFSEACNYELKNRIRYQDNRRLMFSKQLELLKYVDSDFADRQKLEIDKILLSNPFDDSHHSLFDLIDDFENIALELDKIYKSPHISEKCCEEEIKGIIDKVNKLHHGGTDDILRFCKNLSIDIKLIYSKLKKNNMNLDIKMQLSKIEDILKIADKVFSSYFK